MTDADRLKRYDDLLTAYFPPDFKDWHQKPSLCFADLEEGLQW